MTVGEYILRLQELDPNMLVLETRFNGSSPPYYVTLDGWWPQFMTVARLEGREGIYHEAVKGEEALTI